MDDVRVVKQILQYPTKAEADPTDAILVQNGGLAGPYQAVSARGLVAGALSDPGGAIGIGLNTPADMLTGVVASNATTLNGCTQGFNWYQNGLGGQSALGVGNAILHCFDGVNLTWSVGQALLAGVQVPSWSPILTLDTLGNITQPAGASITLGRDPINLLDAATMGWTQTYVLDTIQAILEEDFEIGDVFGFVRMDGSTPMTGPLTLAGWATQPMQAVPLQQAQTMGGAWVDSVPPPNPWPGRFWLDSTIWQTFVWTGSEWIIAVNWTTAPPTGGSVWDGGASEWDFGATIWD
jgi:hypothetical protein